MFVYKLCYSNEEVHITYGVFSSETKAEQAKKELLKDVEKDDWASEYYQREIYIAKQEVDKIRHRINN